ncbi:MAG: glycosyltransferase family 4 protein [Chloroflexi bacterium]|nr:glycosyltransferase family 4 protein [Chloroflexota bacterium]
MRILMLSKALVVGAYQRKLEELAAIPGVELYVVVPPYWAEMNAGRLNLEQRYTNGYRLLVEPAVFNGHHHTHFYPGLAKHVARFRPDVFHIDEEPFNLATAHATWLGRRFGSSCVFYTWANIYRRYPPPFNLLEKFSYWGASAAIAGNAEAQAILRSKGFTKPVSIVPQFGVDPDIFAPPPEEAPQLRPMTVGYLGRLVPQKGVDLLLKAVAVSGADCNVSIIGDGVSRGQLEVLAQSLGIAGRVKFVPQVSSAVVPDVLKSLDVLVLPSITTKTWKEQFGRILIEAMSCGVPVVGSRSGEIPNVIGDAGLVFPESDVETLASMLAELATNQQMRRQLGLAGRRRVIAQYTQAAVARQHYEVYKSVVSGKAQT